MTLEAKDDFCVRAFLGYRVRVLYSETREGWEVWLEEMAHFSALCLGSGATREKAITDALRIVSSVNTYLWEIH